MAQQTDGPNQYSLRQVVASRSARPMKDPAAEAARVAAIQAHLHHIVHELHHGKGSHDDPSLPDGPTIDLTDDQSSGRAATAAPLAAAPRPEASMQGGL